MNTPGYSARLAVATALVVALVPLGTLAYAEDTLAAAVPTTSATPSPTAEPTALTPTTFTADVRTLSLVSRRVGSPALTSASGYAVANNDGSRFWASRQNRALIPASTMKVLTAVVALDTLGGNWRPRTTVAFDPTSGALTIIGGGDAMLSSAQLRTLAQRTATALSDTSTTATTLYLDDTLFPTPTPAAGVSASLQPSEIRPVRPLVVDRRRTMDSASDAARRFRSELAALGVDVTYGGRARSTGTEIAGVAGLTLTSAVRTMLWYSDNDIAEMLFRLSAIGDGRSGTWSDARATAHDHLSRMGIALDGAVLLDGSGLSRRNRLTPEQLVQVLTVARTWPATAALPQLLPTAGENGTLRLRYRTKPSLCVRGELVAKTGGLHDVVSLAGYAPLPNGDYRPFAIVVNDLRSVSAGNAARRAIDALAAAFSGC